MGLREKVSVSQVRTFLVMESQAEKMADLAQKVSSPLCTLWLIEQNQEANVKLEVERKSKELARLKKEKERMGQTGNSYPGCAYNAYIAYS